jgi:hypothetical protein
VFWLKRKKKRAAGPFRINKPMHWIFHYLPVKMPVYAFFNASDTATEIATVAPTIGLFPIPRKPIISTWAGTELDPANWASECIRPIMSVMP